MALDSPELNNPPPEIKITRGREVLGRLTELISEAQETMKEGREDISARVVDSTINGINNYYESYRVANGSDLYAAVDLNEDGQLFFRRDEGYLPSFGIARGESEEEKPLTEEEADKVASIFSLVETKNHLVLIGGSSQTSKEDMEKVAKFLEKRDSDISNKLARPLRRKAIIMSATDDEYWAELGVNADAFDCRVVIGPEFDLFYEDGEISDDFKDKTTFALAAFYFGEYKNIFHPEQKINPAWYHFERDASEIRGAGIFGRVNYWNTEKDIEKRKQRLEERIPEALDTLFDTKRARLLKAIFDDDIDFESIDYFGRLKQAGYDFRAVREIQRYKHFVDWILAYNHGFLDMVEGELSEEERKEWKQPKAKYVGLELESSYKEILDEVLDDPQRETDNSRYYFRYVMKDFMRHLVKEYGTTFYEMAEAVSKMNAEKYDPETFCNLLGVTYQDAIDSWNTAG